MKTRKKPWPLTATGHHLSTELKETQKAGLAVVHDKMTNEQTNRAQPVSKGKTIRSREYRAIAFLLVAGLALWFAESGLDLYVIYSGGKLGPLISTIQSHKIFIPFVGIICFIGYSLYITKTRSQINKAESELEQSEERYRLLTENSLTGIYIMQEGRFVFVNDRLAELLGYRPEELDGRSFADFVHEDDLEIFQATYSTATVEDPGIPQLEIRICCAEGRTKWVEVLGTTMTYRGAIAYMGNVADVTERKLAEHEREQLISELTKAREALQFQATHDGLTGMWNRTAILDHINRVIVQGAREKRPFTVIMADLDCFKAINDRYGHPIGDTVLEEVAARISGTVRPYDLVGRYGGEEILIVLPGCGTQEAREVAERIRLAVSNESIETNAGPIPITISLGVVTVGSPESADLHCTILAADEAMYRAKNAGRNRVEAGEVSAECSNPGKGRAG